MFLAEQNKAEQNKLDKAIDRLAKSDRYKYPGTHVPGYRVASLRD